MRPDQKLIQLGLLATVLAVVIVAAHGPAWSNGSLTALADPTMPPPSLRKPGNEAPASANNGASAGSTPSASPGTAIETPTRMPRLQSIYSDAGSGQTSVMLDGQIRQAGERFGAWTVQTISPDSVTLRGVSGTVRMHLLGGQDKLKQRPGKTAMLTQKEQP